MLNKKSIFNIVYAIALFGAFTSCVGILNELLNFGQLFGSEVNDMYEFTSKSFWIPFVYYFISFIISAVTITFLILHLINKFNCKYLNSLIIISCLILFILSLTLIYLFLDGWYLMQYYEYLIVYTLRSGIMSFIANMIVIVLCNSIDKKSKIKSSKSFDINLDSLQ